MANACNPCPCGEMEGACDACSRAAYFKPVPERLVTCKHGDSKNLCLRCRTERDVTMCVHDRVAEACKYCSREVAMEDVFSVEKLKPPVDPLGFCLWLQSQNTDCLAEWIKQSC
jgi:hypothetical protein